jgi:hypothetical protein
MRPHDWPHTDGWAGFFYAMWLGGLGCAGMILSIWIASLVYNFDIMIVWR